MLEIGRWIIGINGKIVYLREEQLEVWICQIGCHQSDNAYRGLETEFPYRTGETKGAGVSTRPLD